MLSGFVKNSAEENTDMRSKRCHGGEKFCALTRSPLLTQCRQIALFATQVQNGLFVNAHLLTTLQKHIY